MIFTEIDVEETHIRLTSDINPDVKYFIYSIRNDLKSYINRNQDFLLSIEPIKIDYEKLPLIVDKMYCSSIKADVGPMACVAGTKSELTLDYLIEKGFNI